MALELDGTATTIKKRSRKRVRCDWCKGTIRLRSEIVYTDDGHRMHLGCAADFKHRNDDLGETEVVSKLEPCPECFTIAPCLCVGS